MSALLSDPRRCTEHGFPTHDDVSLFYRHWPAQGDASSGAIVLIHRGHEHSGRMAHLADELGLPDFDIFAYDMRGHGKSTGRRGHVDLRARDRRALTQIDFSGALSGGELPV